MFSLILSVVLAGDLPKDAFDGMDLPREVFVGIAPETQEISYLDYSDARKFALQHKVDLILVKEGSKETYPLYQKSLDDQCAFGVLEETDTLYDKVEGDSVRLNYRGGELYLPAKTKRVTIGESPFEELYQIPQSRQTIKCRNCR